MRLLVDRLGSDPTELQFEGSPEWLEALAPGSELAEAVVEAFVFTLRAHRMNEDLFLEGEAVGAFELACGRCLKRYRSPVREPFRLVLEPAGARHPADPEGVEALDRDGLVLSEELESGWFRGPEVQLENFLQEVIAAGLPLKPLCREDCSGLCPSCGIDRNESRCDCREEKPESPFAALAGLRDELVKRSSERQGEGEES